MSHRAADRKTVGLEEIQAYSQRLAVHFAPEKIILFGSYAQGQPDAGSDVDLLVLMEFEGSPQMQAYEIRRSLPRDFPLDLIVRRPDDWARRLQLGDFFFKEILEKGTVLHERAGG